MKKKFFSIFLAIGAFLGMLTFNFYAKADDTHTLKLSVRQAEEDDYLIMVCTRELSSHLEALGFAHLNQMPNNARRYDEFMFVVSSDELINYHGDIYYRSQFMLPFFYRVCTEAGVTADEYANGARSWSFYGTIVHAVELTRAGIDKVVPILRDRYNIILNILPY